MDGREVEGDITKWTVEDFTLGDPKRNRKRGALKKWMSSSIYQQAEALLGPNDARLNPPHELYSMFFLFASTQM